MILRGERIACSGKHRAARRCAGDRLRLDDEPVGVHVGFDPTQADIAGQRHALVVESELEEAVQRVSLFALEVGLCITKGGKREDRTG